MTGKRYCVSSGESLKLMVFNDLCNGLNLQSFSIKQNKKGFKLSQMGQHNEKIHKYSSTEKFNLLFYIRNIQSLIIIK